MQKESSMAKPLSCLLGILLSLSGCSALYYVPDISQGKYLEPAQIDALQPGMDRREVLAVLGSPPTVSPFHQQRWDYPYYLRRNDALIEARELTLYFDEQGRLARIEGDYRNRLAATEDDNPLPQLPNPIRLRGN